MNHFWSQHLERLCASLIAQTNRIRAGSEHTVIKGTSIEVVIRRILTEYLPNNFAIGTGQVVNNQDEISPQVDVLIYDANTFPRLAVNEDLSVIVCCECVLAAIECKASYDHEIVSKHFAKFIDIESKRYGIFGEQGMHAGYFVLVIDPMKPKLQALETLETKDRFVGLYSLSGKKYWFSKYESSDFLKESGNALDIFLNHVMYDCMRKGFFELGNLEYTYKAVSQYLGWDAGSSRDV